MLACMGQVAVAQPTPDPFAMRSAPAQAEADAPHLSLTLPASQNVALTQGRATVVQVKHPIKRVLLANPSVADVVPLSPTEVMLLGKMPGNTSLTLQDDQGQRAHLTLSITLDASTLLEAITLLTPNEPELAVRLTPDALIVSGQLSNALVAKELQQVAAAYGYRNERYIDLTQSLMPQVALAVKVVEANRSVLREIKTGFGITGDNNVFITKLDSISPQERLVQLGKLPLGGFDKTGGLFTAVGAQIANGLTLEARFELWEREGKVKLLAEPTLVATHGHEASFLAGGEFPIVTAVNQNGTPVISFKEFGIRLKFTPKISPKTGRIELRIEPEVSSIDPSFSQSTPTGQSIVGLATRKSDTTLELGNGETFMMAGLLTRDERDSLQKVPWIGDLPILGSLFRNSSRDRLDRELLIVVTPTVVQPKSSPPLSLGLPPAANPTAMPIMPTTPTFQGSYPTPLPPPQSLALPKATADNFTVLPSLNLPPVSPAKAIMPLPPLQERWVQPSPTLSPATSSALPVASPKPLWVLPAYGQAIQATNATMGLPTASPYVSPLPLGEPTTP
jgi:pilus assembly protein CpaC